MGKLPWRVDWPARWTLFNVTFEAFGKDHAAAGGSWDTGKEIVEKVYCSAPPMPLFYEFIQLKGKGAMHSSTGTAISAEEILKMTPPEVLRFLFMKTEPFRHIDFDQGLGLLDLVDEYDRYERMYFGLQDETTGTKDARRVYELSQPFSDHIHDTIPVQIPYRHVVTLIQIAQTTEGVIHILKRNGEITTLTTNEEKNLLSRINRVRYWLDKAAPDVIKFSVQDHPPTLTLTQREKDLLLILYRTLKDVCWEPEAIHNAIYSIASKKPDQKQQDAKILFKLIYKVFLSKDRGPRVGYFLNSLGKEFVLERLSAYS